MSIHAEADRISKASDKWSRIADDTVKWQQIKCAKVISLPNGTLPSDEVE